MCLRTKLSGRVRTVWGRIIGTGSGLDAGAIDIVIQYLMLSIGSKETWKSITAGFMWFDQQILHGLLCPC